MGIGIGILLTLVAVAVVAWPFLRRRPAGADFEVVRTPDSLRQARAEVYRQIRQLELDHAAGLVTDKEFRAEFDELRSEAARLLMRESASAGMSDPAAELEREIAEARASLAKAPGEAHRKGKE